MGGVDSWWGLVFCHSLELLLDAIGCPSTLPTPHTVNIYNHMNSDDLGTLIYFE